MSQHVQLQIKLQDQLTWLALLVYRFMSNNTVIALLSILGLIISVACKYFLCMLDHFVLDHKSHVGSQSAVKIVSRDLSPVPPFLHKGPSVSLPSACCSQEDQITSINPPGE